MSSDAVPPSNHRSDASTPASPAAQCPFCGSNDNQLRWHTHGEDGTAYQVRTCYFCGTGFIHPPPTELQLAHAYANSYYGNGTSKFNSHVERFRSFFSNFRVRHLTRGLSENASVLDVGCGDGRLLRQLGRNRGYSLHGVELPGRAAERAGQVPGLRLHLGTLDSVQLPDESFDLITLVHVYEHLPSPRFALDKLVTLLRPGGRLFLAFPNITSWQARLFGGDWFHLDPPRHLTLVPPPVVTEYLASKGIRLCSDRHLCLEQNTYGWLQSALNRCDSKRNFLYERLKRNLNYVPHRGRGTLILHALAAGAMLPFALALDFGAALVRTGATVELSYQKH